MKLPSFFGKTKDKKGTESLTFSITGMHCVACALNIDGAIEELLGVTESHTNYAKAVTVVSGDRKLMSPAKILQAIKDAGYEAKLQQ